MTNTKALGVDISHWQNNISTPQMYDPMKTRSMGGSFVGIKTSQSTWADSDFVLNWAHCKGKLYRMPYHFLTWTTDPKAQADAFWRLIEPDTWGLLPLICDFEWWETTPPNAMDILYNFMERLKALASPLPLGIYTAKSFFEPNGSRADYWRQYALWLCDIAGAVEVPRPWTDWDFHQYTFKLDGIAWGAESFDLDGDYYNGTLAQMIARYNLPALDEIDPPPVIEPQPAAALSLRVLRNVTLRAAPTTASASYGLLAPGTLLTVTGIAGGATGAWARLADGRYVCAVDRNNTRYLSEV